MATVGVDLMGGDQPPHVIFDAAVNLGQKLNPTDRLLVIATEWCYAELSKTSDPRIEFVIAEESIEMDEPPLFAVRRKKKSSMAMGIGLLQERTIDAFVSCGNTGALVAFSMLNLPMLPGIERCALLVQLPTDTVVLDVGANLTAKADHLLGYAWLGEAFQQSMNGLKKPKIGLLNIGAEETKGTRELKEAYQTLQDHYKKQFFGNIEGREVFQAKVDVVVTDGLTGNVFLKTSEGVAQFLMEYVKTEFPETQQLVSHLHRRFDYSAHPGGLLCGIDGIIIKCHGHSDRTAVRNALGGAFDLIHRGTLDQMRRIIA